MDSLVIDKTISTPKIIFDYSQKLFELEGCSRPEDVRTFFAPVIKWLNEFEASIEPEMVKYHKSSPIVFKFKFDYFNSSSAKFILDILVLINNIHSAGLNIRIDWCYEADDDDMKEVGEELSDVVDFPFKYVELV